MASLVKTDKISKIAGGSQEFTLPAADGTANQHLKTDGSGVLGWASAPSITGSTNTWIPTITGADALTGTANFTYDGNTLDVKNGGTASSINLYCESSNAHYIKLKSGPHASATSYTLTLPNAPPTVSGQALTATTAGVASWAAPGVIKKMHTFTTSARSVGTAPAGNQLTITASGFIPLDPVNNNLWVQASFPVISIGNNFSGIGIRLSKSGGSDYDNFGKGVDYSAQYGMNGYQAGITIMFNLAPGTIPAGTYSLFLQTETTDSRVKIVNPNSTDDARIATQTQTHCQIMEWLN